LDETDCSTGEDQLERIEQILNAAKIKEELDALKNVHSQTLERLHEQTDRSASCEARAVSAELCQKESEKVLKEKLIEFEVIERYWKSTEAELRKQISEMQHERFQTEQLLSTAETVKHSATESCNSYKQQADDLKSLPDTTEARNKEDVAKLEKSLHTSWFTPQKCPLKQFVHARATKLSSKLKRST